MTDYERKALENILSEEEIELIEQHRKELQEQAEKKHIFDDLRYNLLEALEDVQDRGASLTFTFKDSEGITTVHLDDLVQMNLTYRNLSGAIEI